MEKLATNIGDGESSSSNEHPFALAWLDSAYLETLLPGSPWQNVAKTLMLFFK
jgi:hypothetical protein